MKFRLPKKRRYRIPLYLLSFFLIFLAVDLVWVRYWRIIHIGYETTRITGPLNPDGTINYQRALDQKYGDGVTPDNNAAPLLLAAVGPSFDIRPETLTLLYERLGMQPLSPNGDYFEDSFNYAQRVKSKLTGDDNDEFAYVVLQSPTYGSEHPEIAQWVQANQRPLDLFGEASRRPRYFVPAIGSSVSDAAPFLGRLRAFQGVSTARALLRFHAGDFAGAREDILAALRVDRLLGYGSTLIDRLVAFAIDNRATDTLLAITATEKLTSEQAKELLAKLSELPPLRCDDTFDAYERFTILEFVAQAANEGPGNWLRKHWSTQAKFTDGQFCLLNNVPAHFDFLLTQVNGIFDDYADTFNSPSFARRAAQFDAIERRIDRYSDARSASLLHDPGAVLLSYLVPALPRAHVLWVRQLARVELTRVALALAAYHADHGQYPFDLNALIPAYLPKLPDDPFEGLPFHYTLNAPGQPPGYLLYSVGENMKDDRGFGNGRRDPKRPKNYDADDLYVCIPRIFRLAPATSASQPATQPH